MSLKHDIVLRYHNVYPCLRPFDLHKLEDIQVKVKNFTGHREGTHVDNVDVRVLQVEEARKL